MKQTATSIGFEATAYDEVDSILREDPAGAFDLMDASTREQYRQATRELARASKYSTADVASCAIRLAREAAAESRHPHERHIGHYLIGDGIDQTREALGLQRIVLRAPGSYVAVFLAVFLGTAYLLIGMVVDWLPDWILLFAALPLAIVTFDLSMSLVNQSLSAVVAPKAMPRMDFSLGIPGSHRVLVAIPCMLTSTKEVVALATDLEQRFSANCDDNVLYCLLTDFVDATEERTPHDDDLLNTAVQAIEGLRTKHGVGRFFLLNRPREWNPAENAWMGRERKRGKLVDLCRLLAHGDASAFTTIVGDVSSLKGIPYVLSLDSDNALPEQAVRMLVEVVAHPLATPVISESERRVTSGYGVLQPRPLVARSDRDVSLFQALGTEPALGIPEDGPKPDIFQDIFGEGSYFGKGLLNVEVFDHLFSHRFPDNRILSHDLIEGCFARCAAVTDVSLPELAPKTYLSHITRRHRWVRGDWQLASWLFSRIPGTDGGRDINTLSRLSRWKIAHNLLRSIMPVAYFVLLVGAAVMGAWWAGVVLMLMALPPVLSMLMQVLSPPKDFPSRAVIARTLGWRVATQIILNVAFVVHESWVSLDAIARSLWRMSVTHKFLLEWQPFQHVPGKTTMKIHLSTMWMSPVIGAIALALSIGLGNFAVMPIFALWVVAPWLARSLGETHLDA